MSHLDKVISSFGQYECQIYNIQVHIYLSINIVYIYTHVTVAVILPVLVPQGPYHGGADTSNTGTCIPVFKNINYSHVQRHIYKYKDL